VRNLKREFCFIRTPAVVRRRVTRAGWGRAHITPLYKTRIGLPIQCYTIIVGRPIKLRRSTSK